MIDFKTIDVLIVGAGHAGLTMSYLLNQSGREHVVVERRVRLGGGWQDRWDEFRLVTPNWGTSLPGWAYDGDQPHDFMRRDEITERIARYAEVIAAPVSLDTEVQRLTPVDDGGFRVETNRGDFSARQVVVATGSYHKPRVPSFAGRISSRILQMHSHNYRNVAALPPGGVLVVGSGQTGVQLAEELFEAGRPVFISVGSAGRVPRRYRGRDIFEWLADIVQRGGEFGVALPTVDQLPDPRGKFRPNPGLSGHGGGHETNLRQYALYGMALAGHLTAADGEHLTFANDLESSLTRADKFFDEVIRGKIDTFIERAAINAPPDTRIGVSYEPQGLTELNLLRAGISTIIWATGYDLDFQWIDAPILDELNYPRNVRGVSSVPGIYYLGLLWQHSQASATLFGTTLDSPYLVERMANGAP